MALKRDYADMSAANQIERSHILLLCVGLGTEELSVINLAAGRFSQVDAF